MRWSADWCSWAITMAAQGYTQAGIAQAVTHHTGQPCTAKAVERALWRSRRGASCDIPVTWDDEDEVTQVEKPANDNGLERILFIPDCHHPYVDRRAWRLMLKSARLFAPDRIVVLGDFADCYSVSFHSRDPRRVSLLQDEVDKTREALDELDALGAKTKNFVEGNHEFRLARYLQDKAPALFGMFDIPSLLQLEQRGWSYTPYRSHLTIGKLNVTHEVGDASQFAANRARATFEGNVIIGHCHKMAAYYAGNAKGESHVGMSFGWLGSAEEADYMHKVKALRDWQHGFGIGYMEPCGTVHLQPVPIVNGRCVVNGQLVTEDLAA